MRIYLKWLFLPLSLIFALSGCDTISRYRAKDLNDETDVSKGGKYSRQQLKLSDEQSTIKVKANRFNFSMDIALEIENSGMTTTEFSPRKVKLTGGKEAELPLIGLWLRFKTKKEQAVDNDAVFEIAPGGSLLFSYAFDLTKVMGLTHLSQTDAQKTLHFESTGLQRGQQVVPIDLTFQQI